MIYYLSDIKNNLVKIGYTTPKQIQKRFGNLMTGNPFDFRLLGCHSGNLDREKSIHKVLKAHRKNREWFYLDRKVIGYIEEHTDFEYFFDVYEDKLNQSYFDSDLYKLFIQRYAMERLGNKNFVKLSLFDWIDREFKLINHSTILLDVDRNMSHTVIDGNNGGHNNNSWRDNKFPPIVFEDISEKVLTDTPSTMEETAIQWKSIKKRNDSFPF